MWPGELVGRPAQIPSSLTIAGGSPGAGHFLLRGQEKVTKEKAAPFAPQLALRSPALLAKPGGCATRTQRSNSARRKRHHVAIRARCSERLQYLTVRPGLAALLGGSQGPDTEASSPDNRTSRVQTD